MTHKNKLFVLLLFLFTLFLSCSNDDGENTPAANYDGYGKIALSYEEEDGTSRATTIEIFVYDKENNQIKYEKWEYDDFQKVIEESEDGTIVLEDVPAGPECTIVVLGRQYEGDIITRAEKVNFSIDASRATNPVTVTASDFYATPKNPLDDSISTIDTLPAFSWESVPGAAQYKIVVIGQLDFINIREDDPTIAINEITAETSFAPTAVKEHVNFIRSAGTEPEQFYPFPDTGQNIFYNNLEDTGSSLSFLSDEDRFFYGQDSNYTYLSPSYSAIEYNGSENFITENTIKNYTWEVYPIDAYGNMGYCEENYRFSILWRMTRDNITGLTWELKTKLDDSIHDNDKKFTWQEAENFINELNSQSYGGYNDWRLPTIKEISSLIRHPITNNKVLFDEDFFPFTVSAPFQSSTLYAHYNTDRHTRVAWVADFSNGHIYEKNYLLESIRVRAVRGTAVTSEFVDNGDNTITDTASGLMWTKEKVGESMTWEEALQYCQDLTLGGYDDWRLPNKNELQSIIDYSRRNPVDEAAIATAFNGSDPDAALQYWSSTTSIIDPVNAYTINLGTGECSSNNKIFAKNIMVRAVRNIQ